MATIEHNGKKYPIPEGATAETTFESLKQVVPELAGAKLKPAAGGNYTADVNYGRKG